MPVCDRAAVRIHLLEHLFFRHAEDRAGAHDGHRREGLVDLDDLHVVDGHVVLIEDLLDGKPRDRGDVLGGLGNLGIVQDGEQRLHAERLGLLGAHHHADVSAVVDAGRVPRCDTAHLARHGALVVEDRRQLGQAFHGCSRPRTFVLVKNDDVLPFPDFHGKDLVIEPARLHGIDSPRLGLEGPLVLVLPGESELVRRLGAVDGHVPVVEGVPQAVVNHQVHQTPVGKTHPVAPAHVRKGVGAVAHALLAAGDDDFGPSRLDHLHGKVDGLDSRRTDLVDGDGGYALRQTRQQGGLTAGHLSTARRDDLPHDDVIDVLAFHLASGPPQALLDCQGAELRGVEALQGAAENAVGRPAGLDTDHFTESLGGVLDLASHALVVRLSLTELRDGRAGIIILPCLVQFLRYFFHAPLLRMIRKQRCKTGAWPAAARHSRVDDPVLKNELATETKGPLHRERNCKNGLFREESRASTLFWFFESAGNNPRRTGDGNVRKTISFPDCQSCCKHLCEGKDRFLLCLDWPDCGGQPQYR